MHTNIKVSLAAAGLIVTAAAGLTLTYGILLSGVSAQETRYTAPNPQPKIAPTHTALPTKLDSARLKACQAREKAITAIMSRVAERGQKHLEVFSTIASRAESFYTNKEKDKTLANYAALVADVNAKKAAAQTAVANVASKSASFKCDINDPRGVITSFKDALKSEIQALQAYRTAVKNLIVGIKSVHGSATSAASGTGR